VRCRSRVLARAAHPPPAPTAASATSSTVRQANDQASRRFALRENHGSRARIRGEASAVAASRGPTGGDLHYTPVAVARAILAWAISGEAVRFLAVMVIATPCPLLIAVPVAIIGSVSLSARPGIIIESPVVLEQIGGCRTAMWLRSSRLARDEGSSPGWPPSIFCCRRRKKPLKYLDIRVKRGLHQPVKPETQLDGIFDVSNYLRMRSG
jgi:hypothetical protein